MLVKRIAIRNLGILRLEFVVSTMVSLLIIISSSQLFTFVGNAEEQPWPGIDMDNAGNHIIKDDDNDIDDSFLMSGGRKVFKRLWVYQNNLEYADIATIWIYGYVYGTDFGNDPTTNLYINGEMARSFNAFDRFAKHQSYNWIPFRFDPDIFQVGECNEIMLHQINGQVFLRIGVDTTFNYYDGTPLSDFDRSYTSTMSASNFNGELMIYLEFDSIDSTLSKGITDEDVDGYVEIRHTEMDERDLPNKKWDSAGIVLDWTTMNEDTYEKIYLVRLWIYCQPTGNINTFNERAIVVEINQAYPDSMAIKRTYTFNPYTQLPHRRSHDTWTWLIVDIHDASFPGHTQRLNYGQLNHIDIHADEEYDTLNNLKIAKYGGIQPSPKLTWWYVEDDGTYEGAWHDPDDEDCDTELMIYVEVLESDPKRDSELKLFRMGGSSLENNRHNDFAGYDDSGIDDIKNHFDKKDTLIPFWDNNFLRKDTDVRQWTFYGEERTYVTTSHGTYGGDCTDIYFHYGPGSIGPTITAGSISLYDAYQGCENPPDELHNNDDYHHFTYHSGTLTLTEAEGNGELVDQGSNGFNFDLEWIFFYSPGVFVDGQDSKYVSLLWHGAYAVFGFNDATPGELTDLMKNIYFYFDTRTVITSFESSINEYRITDDFDGTAHYFFNSDCEGAQLWGYPSPMECQNSYDRSKIEYVALEPEP